MTNEIPDFVLTRVKAEVARLADTVAAVKSIRRAAREIHSDMPRGGRQGTPKGKRGYTRKAKHPKRDKEQDR